MEASPSGARDWSAWENQYARAVRDFILDLVGAPREAASALLPLAWHLRSKDFKCRPHDYLALAGDVVPYPAFAHAVKRVLWMLSEKGVVTMGGEQPTPRLWETMRAHGLTVMQASDDLWVVSCV